MTPRQSSSKNKSQRKTTHGTVSLRIPAGDGFKNSLMTLDEWEDHLSHCDLAAYAPILQENRLSFLYQGSYSRLMENQDTTRDRRVAMWVAMVKVSETFHPDAYAFIVNQPAFARFCMQAIPKETQVKIVAEGILKYAIDCVNTGNPDYQDAFMNLMKVIEPDVRRYAVLALQWPEFNWELPFSQRIYYLIKMLPSHRQAHAFLSLTEDSYEPGLFTMISFPVGFDYCLSILSESDRYNALICRDSFGVMLIIACLNYPELMTIIFEHLNPDERMRLFQSSYLYGESIFHFMLFYPDVIKLIASRHTSNEIITLCTRPHPGSDDSVPILSFVRRYWGRSEVRASMAEMLYSLSYTARLKLLHFENHLCHSLFTVIAEQEPGVKGSREIANRFLSKQDECQRIIKKFADIADRYFDRRTGLSLWIDSAHVLLQVVEMQLLNLDLRLINEYFNSRFEVFIDHFKDLLLVRYKNDIHYFITLVEMPTLLSSRLYAALIEVLFEPHNLLEFIQSMVQCKVDLPQLCLVSVPETFPAALTRRERLSFFRESPPTIELTPDLSSLAAYPPDLEVLSSFVFYQNVIIPLEGIHRYSFRRHVKLYQQLIDAMPGLAKAVYGHNNEWKILENAILISLKGGITPKEAIENLIQGLRGGGASQTGRDDEAGDVASVAISVFMNYFYGLPQDHREALCELTLLNRYELLRNLPELLKGYFCVEQLSYNFDELLKLNRDHPSLNQNCSISAEYQQHIEKMCRLGLSLIKDESTLRVSVPGVIGNAIIEWLGIRLFNFGVDQLSHLPDELLPFLFNHAPSGEPEVMLSFMQQLNQAFDSHLFTDHKRAMILAAIVNAFSRPELAAVIPLLSAHYRDLLLEAGESCAIFIRSASSEGLYQALMLTSSPSLLITTPVWFDFLMIVRDEARLREVLTRLSLEGLVDLLKQSAFEYQAMLLVAQSGDDLFRWVLGRLGANVSVGILRQHQQESETFLGYIRPILTRLNEADLLEQLDPTPLVRLNR